MKSANSSLGGAFRHCCCRPARCIAEWREWERDGRWSSEPDCSFLCWRHCFRFYASLNRDCLVCFNGRWRPSTVSAQPSINVGRQRVGLLNRAGRQVVRAFDYIVSIQCHCLCNEGWLEQITFLFLFLLIMAYDRRSNALCC